MSGTIYCGKLNILPKEYGRFGTRNECFKKGIQIGMNIENDNSNLYSVPLNSSLPLNRSILLQKHRINKYDHILRIFFAFLLSITLLYTLFSMFKKLSVPFTINILIIVVIGILFIILFVYFKI